MESYQDMKLGQSRWVSEENTKTKKNYHCHRFVNFSVMQVKCHGLVLVCL